MTPPHKRTNDHGWRRGCSINAITHTVIIAKRTAKYRFGEEQMFKQGLCTSLITIVAIIPPPTNNSADDHHSVVESPAMSGSQVRATTYNAKSPSHGDKKEILRNAQDRSGGTKVARARRAADADSKMPNDRTTMSVTGTSDQRKESSLSGYCNCQYFAVKRAPPKAATALLASHSFFSSAFFISFLGTSTYSLTRGGTSATRS